MNNGKLIKIIGGVATVMGLVATVVGNWVNERQTEMMIDEKVNEALAKREIKGEESVDEEEENNRIGRLFKES